jgi:hypothetical protein
LASAGFFFLRVDWAGHVAVLLVNDQGEWKLIRPDLTPWWPREHGFQKGSFHDPFGKKEGFVECYASTPLDAPYHLFSLSSLHFDAVNLGQTKKMFERRFVAGKDWTKVAGGSAAANLPVGSWFAIITGPLLAAAKAQLAEAQQKFKDMCIDVGVNAVSFVDPTGISALVIADRASKKGDYIGCAMALVAVLPVARQVISGLSDLRLMGKIDRLLTEISALKKALDWTNNAIHDFHLRAELAGVYDFLRPELQTHTPPVISYRKGPIYDSVVQELGIVSRTEQIAKAVKGPAFTGVPQYENWNINQIRQDLQIRGFKCLKEAKAAMTSGHVMRTPDGGSEIWVRIRPDLFEEGSLETVRIDALGHSPKPGKITVAGKYDSAVGITSKTESFEGGKMHLHKETIPWEYWKTYRDEYLPGLTVSRTDRGVPAAKGDWKGTHIQVH